MAIGSNFDSIKRREFMAKAGAGLLAAAAVPAGAALASAKSDGPADTAVFPLPPSRTPSPAAKKKIPIGVFNPVYDDLSIDAMLDVHPNATHAAKDADTFRKTVQLAEMLEVNVIVGFSGCPGGTPQDTQPNWITYRWPPEFNEMLQWQWKEKVVPYWKEAAKFARSHGVKRLAFEMHPNFVVYNPRTLLKLREAVGEEIGANNDLSHLFWQGCDPVEVIHFLGKQGAIFHAHMKDTVLFPENLAKYGVLNFAFDKDDLVNASATFRAVGYGHSASLWKSVLQAYMDIGYEGILSIENEDPILSGEVGVERAVYVLKNIRKELIGE